ncbi:hypothetical protein LR69_01109 [Geobacillus sp. BCO2]|nr:hypothetical protein LR69_01109 [Geobacillus sp. BCO2]
MDDGNLAKLFTPYYEEGFVQNYFVRFQSMVFLHDVITLKATVKEKDGKTIRFDVAAVNQHGKEVVKGEAIFALYD